ncbi:hypothetical protein ECZC06_54620 [Escherichia coli]|nr:hypothetical protein ECZC06_54620 [Escherichia coli]
MQNQYNFLEVLVLKMIQKNALKLATFIANSERSTVLIQSILSSGIIRFSDKLIKILDQDCQNAGVWEI